MARNYQFCKPAQVERSGRVNSLAHNGEVPILDGQDVYLSLASRYLKNLPSTVKCAVTAFSEIREPKSVYDSRLEV